MKVYECSVEGCEGSRHWSRRGLCPKHFTRWKRHGDPLYEMTPEQRSERARKGAEKRWHSHLVAPPGLTTKQAWAALLAAPPKDADAAREAFTEACDRVSRYR